MSEKVYNVVNTVGQEGTVQTSKGEMAFGTTGDFTVRDEGIAHEIKDRYPYLEVQASEVYHPVHPMRVTTIALPWATYDGRGRRIHDDNAKRPTPTAR